MPDPIAKSKAGPAAMKSTNPYESPETVGHRHPVGGPNWFVILFWALIPAGSVFANVFLNGFYQSFGIDLPVISKMFFSWYTPVLLAAPATGVIVAMFRMPPGTRRFWFAMFAVFFGAMLVFVFALAYLLPWWSIQEALRKY